MKLSPEVRAYMAELGSRSKGVAKTITKAERKRRGERLALARAAVTPEVIAKRAATRRANNLARKASQ